MKHKVDYVWRISALIGVEVRHMSTGSTEPRELFVAVNEELGLGLATNATKPDLARGIVEAAGEVWLSTYESTGSTITLQGLQAVCEAVEFFIRS